MIKAIAASVLLAGGAGFMAPIALAASSTESGADTCRRMPLAGALPDSALSAGEVPARAVPAGPGRAVPIGCKMPADSGGRLPGADEAVARALRLVGSHGYYQLCARLAANIWGRPRAGYFSAAEQWRQMIATSQAHLRDRQPPTGALVFWHTGGPYGHVATYVGNGRIVSNDIGDSVPGEGGVYLVAFGVIESKWGATYLGWAPPSYPTT
ncbi:CHAP domain-containing protein [Kribbella solani]|uniref:CHAP domain-containing protein n=1 Tax=Kribbella solani TaxID=236067 RepID=UPI0038D3AD6A